MIFLGYVTHDVSLYLLEKFDDGCKVLLYESPCSSCSSCKENKEEGYYEIEEEVFCRGGIGTFRCQNCHVEE